MNGNYEPTMIELSRADMANVQEPDDDTSWLHEAERIVLGARQNSYAHPLINFLRIAIDWSEWLMGRGKLVKGTACDPGDVAMMMAMMKLSGREVHRHSDDNMLDTIGYVFCWQRIDEALKQLGFTQGMGWFDGRAVYQLMWMLEQLSS